MSEWNISKLLSATWHYWSPPFPPSLQTLNREWMRSSRSQLVKKATLDDRIFRSRHSRSVLKSSMRIISWSRAGGLRIRTLRRTGTEMRKGLTVINDIAAVHWGRWCLTSLPFDGAQESRASLVVESDDDTRGGKVAVIIQGRTPADSSSRITRCLCRWTGQPPLAVCPVEASQHCCCSDLKICCCWATTPEISAPLCLLLGAIRLGKKTWRRQKKPTDLVCWNLFMWSKMWKQTVPECPYALKRKIFYQTFTVWVSGKFEHGARFLSKEIQKHDCNER